MKDKKVKKESIIKDAMALFVVTLVCALALSYIYELTKAPIAEQNALKKERAYQAVYPDTKPVLDEKLMNLVAETDLTTLDSSYKNVTIDEINQAYDSSNNLVGYILQVSNKGYKDTVTMTFGYTLEGTLTRVEFLALNETAGLGMNASKPEFIGQFSDKTVDQFEVTKTGATSDNQIDAISSATITSRAVTNAINAGIKFLNENAEGLGGGANE
jgi:electron transport complex protein RnfG